MGFSFDHTHVHTHNANTHTLHQGGNPYQDNDCRHETAFPGTKRNDITLIAATGHTLNQKPHKTPKNQKNGPSHM